MVGAIGTGAACDPPNTANGGDCTDSPAVTSYSTSTNKVVVILYRSERKNMREISVYEARSATNLARRESSANDDEFGIAIIDYVVRA